MDEAKLSRLIEVINRDPRSPNRISTDAGLGRNYVRSITEEGKNPSEDRLTKILATLGEGAAFYVLTGYHANEEDMEFLSLAARLPEAAKRSAMQMFRDILSHEESSSHKSSESD